MAGVGTVGAAGWGGAGLGAAGVTAPVVPLAGTGGPLPAAGSGGGPAAGGGGAAAVPIATEKFSFFVTSLQGMRDLSQNQLGFGGDLRYGEATGLAGADKICTDLAERSLPGAGAKGWRAFLSTEKGGPNGAPTHAKDRIGAGPWFDRTGRIVAMATSDLLQDRPSAADPAIKDDLPNERGEPNHTDTVEGMDDNHDTVTGSNAQGMWNGEMTCEDWTSHETPMPVEEEEQGAAGSSGGFPGGGFPGGGFPGGFMHYGPGVGHSWPSEQSGTSWMATHSAPGCGPSVALVQEGAGEGTGIGNGGGYGGIYCFALMP